MIDDPDITERLPVITTPSVPVDTSSRSAVSSHSRTVGMAPATKVLIIFLMAISLFVGIGMGQTFFAHKSNAIIYCAGGVCATEYHDHCSDWFDLQHP
jgi:hypothetical protein